MTSPVVSASGPAKYTLSCTPPPAATLSASAQVSPPNESVDCSAAPSPFTFNGTITASGATTVTYFWKLPSGDGPPQTLSFTRAGTLAVSPDSFTPGAHDQTGSGQIIVTSPEATASNAATFTLSCHSGKSAQLSISPDGGALPSGTVLLAAPSSTLGDELAHDARPQFERYDFAPKVDDDTVGIFRAADPGHRVRG